MIDPLGGGDYLTINEALSKSSAFEGSLLVMRLSAGEHSVGDGLVLNASLTLSQLRIIATTNASITSSASTLITVRAGAPPVELQGLGLNGQIRIEDGTVEIADCRFDSTSERTRRRLQIQAKVRALLISGGSVSISDTVFEGLQAGAIEVSGGTLAVNTSAFQSNQAESGGALLITGGDVRVQNSKFVDNKATGGPGSGGAFRVIGLNANLELATLTEITGSKGFGGSVASDVAWTYILPAPLAHYVSNPEQDGLALNSAGTFDYNYPIPCAATLRGTQLQDQLRCLCPPGSTRLPKAELAPAHSAAASGSASGAPLWPAAPQMDSF